MNDLTAKNELDQLAEQLPMQLKHLRHVRIMLVDSFGNLTVVSPQPRSTARPRCRDGSLRWSAQNFPDVQSRSYPPGALPNL